MFKGGHQKQPSGPIRYSLLSSILFVKIMFPFFLKNAFWINYRGTVVPPRNPKPPGAPNHSRSCPGAVNACYVPVNNEKPSGPAGEVNIHRFKFHDNLNGISNKKLNMMVRSPGKIRIFLKVFFRTQSRLGSPKSDIFYQESKITNRNLILSFFPLNGFHIGIHLQIHPICFCFFEFWNLQQKKGGFERQASKKIASEFPIKNPSLLKETFATRTVPTGWTLKIPPPQDVVARGATGSTTEADGVAPIDSDEAPTREFGCFRK